MLDVVAQGLLVAQVRRRPGLRLAYIDDIEKLIGARREGLKKVVAGAGVLYAASAGGDVQPVFYETAELL
ncbi:MAG: hypothetical protein ABL957_15705 [Parvularculaceae bacterium]